jgi:hypothetical protein
VSQKESSGLRVNYYLVQVDTPQREEQPPYQAECEDIMDALGLVPDEANIFKEIWRTANERTHGKGKEGNTPLRAAQKLVHYSGRMLKKAERAPKQEPLVIQPNNWINWDGGYVPVGGEQLVQVLLRCGNATTAEARMLLWAHHDCADDIVKYRLVD